MPTGVNELFINGAEDEIRSQLKAIHGGLDKAALFAQKVRPSCSTEIYFLVDDAPPSTKSKYEPDASFWHEDAKYPGLRYGQYGTIQRLSILNVAPPSKWIDYNYRLL